MINKNKAKIKVNKLKNNPLFIKFLNWKGDKYSIEKIMFDLIDSFQDQRDKDIVTNQSLNEDYLNNLSNFHIVFKKNIQQTIIDKNISENFVSWMDNAFKYVEEKVAIYAKDEVRYLSIKEEKGRWFEGIVIYNFIMTFNYFGADIIKQCPICSHFFCHKGRWAKYCSEPCKSKGMGKS